MTPQHLYLPGWAIWTPLPKIFDSARRLLRNVRRLKLQAEVLKLSIAPLPVLEAFLCECGRYGLYDEEVKLISSTRDAMIARGTLVARDQWFSQWRSFLSHTMMTRDWQGLQTALTELKV